MHARQHTLDEPSIGSETRCRCRMIAKLLSEWREGERKSTRLLQFPCHPPDGRLWLCTGASLGVGNVSWMQVLGKSASRRSVNAGFWRYSSHQGAVLNQHIHGVKPGSVCLLFSCVPPRLNMNAATVHGTQLTRRVMTGVWRPCHLGDKCESVQGSKKLKTFNFILSFLMDLDGC